MTWTWAALMPHPPILVPEVGREREAAPTLEGVRGLTKKLATLPRAGRPDFLLMLSPHQPYAQGGLFINTAPEIKGGLERFGAPGINFHLNTAPQWSALVDHLRAAGLPLATAEINNLSPDHGSIVPLYFLAEIFGQLPPVILANPIGLTPVQALALGRALAGFNPSGPNWALLASGDLSHRLTPEAPAGFNPEGRIFDQDVMAALAAGDPEVLIEKWPMPRLEAAGECGFRSVLALLGLAGGPVEPLSYEGPFGVGYGTALRINPEATDAAVPAGSEPPPDSAYYPRLARLTVETYLAERELSDDLWSDLGADPAIWSLTRACFVSIKNKDGSLRGCIGTILPTQPGLAREIMANAVSAATRDPRFPPMTARELPGVIFSVDVLSPPEPVGGLDQLDPARWGVIVTKGRQRGLLLPDLEGVDTVEKQVSIAAQKAGLSSLAGVSLERFSVTRYKEDSERDDR